VIVQTKNYIKQIAKNVPEKTTLQNLLSLLKLPN